MWLWNCKPSISPTLEQNLVNSKAPEFIRSHSVFHVNAVLCDWLRRVRHVLCSSVQQPLSFSHYQSYQQHLLTSARLQHDAASLAILICTRCCQGCWAFCTQSSNACVFCQHYSNCQSAFSCAVFPSAIGLGGFFIFMGSLEMTQ